MALQDSYFYSQNTPDYIEKSFARNMIRYAPGGAAPLFGFTAELPKATAKDVEHGYFSKTMKFPKVVVDNVSGYNSSATTLIVDSTEEVVPGELLLSPANEVLRVETIQSATSLTVRRQVGQVSAAPIVDNAVLYSIGNAFEQASLRPISRLMNPVRVSNNTQIFRNSWALPKTVTKLIPVVGDSLVAESRMDCGLFHAADIEKALFFGQKSGQMVNQQYLTTMDGLIETVRRLAPIANTTTAGSTTTYDQLESALDPVFDTVTDGRSGNERVIFAGSAAVKVFNQIGRLSGQYQIVQGQTEYGLQYSSFRISRGSFKIVEHPLFNSNAVWKKLAVAVDLSSLRVPYLRPTENIEYGMNGYPTDNGIDAVGGTLTTELTMENLNPSAHAVIWGLTAGAGPSP